MIVNNQHKTRKNILLYLFLLVCLLIGSFLLLQDDAPSFLRWWLLSFLCGIGFYPLGAVLFRCFDDKGWLFARVLGIALGGFLSWALIRAGLIRFRTLPCMIVTVIAAILIWILFLWYRKMKKEKISVSLPNLSVMLRGEVIFLIFFLFWTYLCGFRPAASGTEKFMDYGFMAAMFRSDTLPAKDLWYSSGTINYYYGGQYMAVYLTRLSFTRINEGYNLMRSLVAAFSFALPWSIVRQALEDRFCRRSIVANPDQREQNPQKSIVDSKTGADNGNMLISEAGGLLAGAAVSLAGNMHYILYGMFGSVFQLSGWEDYWFPSSTRFIGHNPLTDDQCIHEFPCYSFVLGDLHAHMINLMFVFLFIGIMYAWFQCRAGSSGLCASLPADRDRSGHLYFLRETFTPHVLAAGFLTGLFQWTNYWDYIIYLTVFLFCSVSLQMIRKDGIPVRVRITEILLQLLTVVVLMKITALPFTSAFTAMYNGVALAQNHTALYQFLILWGLPLSVCILLAAVVVRKGMHFTDVFFVLLSVCAIGLILIPELVYVRDIYEQGYARSNTMFKLTYQAYVMFGMIMAYSFFRLIRGCSALPIQILASVQAFLLCLTLGYSEYSIQCWFGDITDRDRYQGLDAEAFLETDYPEDASAIRWLEENVSGSPVVLEANGDSYSENCRVSAMTGLPTVLGWYVHEWLWREDPADLNARAADIEQIYTSQDKNNVEILLEAYDVSYIFIGSCEREKYGTALNTDLLCSLGTVCYDGTEDGTENGAIIIQLD